MNKEIKRQVSKDKKNKKIVLLQISTVPIINLQVL